MSCEIDSWPDALSAVLADSAGPLRNVYVVRETGSTQDTARRMGLVPGEAIVAGRQSSGRGRLGRMWADTSDQGIAITAVVEPGMPERLAIAAAVATACAAEAILAKPVGIKWPNDVMVDGRKLAGVLIEQTADRAYIGIGINVLQRKWPDSLNGIAISMAEIGASATRREVLAELLQELNTALTVSDENLTAAFTQRDVLCGKPASFRTGGAIVSGIVRAIDPMRGLSVLTDEGELWLPAATTSVIKG